MDDEIAKSMLEQMKAINIKMDKYVLISKKLLDKMENM